MEWAKELGPPELTLPPRGTSHQLLLIAPGWVGDALLATWDAGEVRGLGSCLQQTPVSWAPGPLSSWET